MAETKDVRCYTESNMNEPEFSQTPSNSIQNEQNYPNQQRTALKMDSEGRVAMTGSAISRTSQSATKRTGIGEEMAGDYRIWTIVRFLCKWWIGPDGRCGTDTESLWAGEDGHYGYWGSNEIGCGHSEIEIVHCFMHVLCVWVKCYIIELTLIET